MCLIITGMQENNDTLIISIKISQLSSKTTEEIFSKHLTKVQFKRMVDSVNVTLFDFFILKFIDTI